MSNANGSILGQVRPANTTAAAAFTAAIRAEVTSIVVCNTSAGAATFRVYHDDDGTTFDETTALFWDVNVAIGETVTVRAASENGGVQISEGGSLGVRSSVASALTFSVYGVTGDRGVR